jgi:ribonucleoside-triphosphate reductase
MKCTKRTEIFSRVVGFYRPIQMWNPGKKEEFRERKNFVVKGEYNDNTKKDENNRENSNNSIQR